MGASLPACSTLWNSSRSIVKFMQVFKRLQSAPVGQGVTKCVRPKAKGWRAHPSSSRNLIQIRTVCCGQKDRRSDRWRDKEPRKNPFKHSHMVSNHSTKTVQRRAGSPQTVRGKWVSHVKGESRPSLKPHPKSLTQNRPKHKSSKYKTLRRKHWAKIYGIGFGNDFLEMTPKTQATTITTNKQTGLLEKL